MRNRNNVQLIGNIGTNPEVLDLSDNKTRARFSLATQDTYKSSSGQKITETQWHNLVAWGKMAETVRKYLKKGNRIAVEGRLVNRTYDDKKGIKRYVTEVVISSMLLLGNKRTTVNS